MVKISVTYTRPSVSVPWHFEVIDMSAVNALGASPAWADKHQAKPTADFIANGSGTTLVSDVVWSSQADFEAFKATAENQAYEAARDAYNAANGITSTPISYTEV